MSVETVVSCEQSDFAICRPENHLMQAANQMVTRNVDALAVTDGEGRIIGIVTSHDLMKAVAVHNGQISEPGIPVSDNMTRRVITCTSETRLTKALALMGHHRIRHLVVVDGDKPIAMLSIKDVLEKVHQNEELEINVLRDVAVTSLAVISG